MPGIGYPLLRLFCDLPLHIASLCISGCFEGFDFSIQHTFLHKNTVDVLKSLIFQFSILFCIRTHLQIFWPQPLDALRLQYAPPFFQSWGHKNSLRSLLSVY